MIAVAPTAMLMIAAVESWKWTLDGGEMLDEGVGVAFKGPASGGMGSSGWRTWAPLARSLWCWKSVDPYAKVSMEIRVRFYTVYTLD